MKASWRALAIVAVFAGLAGCRTQAKRATSPTDTLPARALLDVDSPGEIYRPYDPEHVLARLGGKATSPLGDEKEPARNLLALSGGGMFGAYTAGVLKGWTATGKRPEFDVVTGISTGSLIAPFAFLGPEYDNILEQRYTTLQASDIFSRRSWVTLLWADALTDSAPLRHLIETEVDDAFLSKLAAAHASGRRLYVGTTNLENKRLIVWDMGAIASSNRPNRGKLFRDVILASCSVPGVLPPVSIEVEVEGKVYTELHADGSVSASIFLDPYMVRDPGQKTPEQAERAVHRANVYAIVAGKLYADANQVRRRWLFVTGESVIGVLQARTEGDLMRLFLLARFTGGAFNLAAVPQKLEIAGNALGFDPVVMRQLFDVGYQSAVDRTAWRVTPPGIEPDEQRVPRVGNRFVIDHNVQDNPKGQSSFGPWQGLRDRFNAGLKSMNHAMKARAGTSPSVQR